MIRSLRCPNPASHWAYVRHVSGLPYWRSRLTTMVRHASGRVDEPFIDTRLHARIVREARLYLAVYAVVLIVPVAAGSAAVLMAWLIPALIGQPFLRCYLLAEHTGCPMVASMLENTRTTLSLAAVRQLAWNMPYHAEHHAYPSCRFMRCRRRIACSSTGSWSRRQATSPSIGQFSRGCESGRPPIRARSVGALGAAEAERDRGVELQAARLDAPRRRSRSQP